MGWRAGGSCGGGSCVREREGTCGLAVSSKPNTRLGARKAFGILAQCSVSEHVLHTRLAVRLTHSAAQRECGDLPGCPCSLTRSRSRERRTGTAARSHAPGPAAPDAAATLRHGRRGTEGTRSCWGEGRLLMDSSTRKTSATLKRGRPAAANVLLERREEQVAPHGTLNDARLLHAREAAANAGLEGDVSDGIPRACLLGSKSAPS